MPSGASAQPDAARCSSGSVSRAASRVFGAGTHVVTKGSLAGLEGALLLEPRIAPGTRARLLRVGQSWCEASIAFNLAWSAAGRSFDESAARALARIAAAPYFDRVTVKHAEETSPGSFTILTPRLLGRTHIVDTTLEGQGLILPF